MEHDSQKQGFQSPIDTFDLVDSQQLIHHQQDHQSYQKLSKNVKPPVSTYLQIKNCATPNYINEVYSFVQPSPKLKLQPIKKTPMMAWCASSQLPLDDQFTDTKYKTIYSKFKQSQSKYQFYTQYSIEQFKTFTDYDSDCHYGNQEDEEMQSNNDSKNCKLVIDKMPTSKIKQLVFRSNFEGGNLQKVYTKLKPKPNIMPLSPNNSNFKTLQSCFEQQQFFNSISITSSSTIQKQYYLLVSNDTNTIGFNQCFYFKVYNPNAQAMPSTFIIVNLNKKTISNIDELGINYFSTENYNGSGEGWKKLYEGITINEQNNLKKGLDQFYHTLQFQSTIKPNDTVYFSLTIPYTFTKLQHLVTKHHHSFDILGTTFCGNPLYIYKTGNSHADKSILIMARQHPSQTSSSFVVEGIINRLSKSSPLLDTIKNKYQIYVIPMVNPDGVIHGNSRTNLLGFDVNRKWEILPNKKSSSEVFILMTELIRKIPQIEYLIDLHGHSKKLNSFAYFSTKKSIATTISYYLSEKLPWFRASNCQLTSTAPLNTLRWYSVSHLQVPKAITLQISIHGWIDESQTLHPFTPQSLQTLGSTLIDTISRVDIQKNINCKYIKYVQFTDQHQSSDSDPQGDYIEQRHHKLSTLPIQKLQISNMEHKQSLHSSKKKFGTKTNTTHFYLPFKNHPLRQRIKTQYTIEKLNIQIPSHSIYTTVSPRQKPSEFRYHRFTQNIKQPSKPFRLKTNPTHQIDYRALTRCVDYFRRTSQEKPNIDKDIYPVVREERIMDRPKMSLVIHMQHLQFINKSKIKANLRYNFSNLLKRRN